MSRRRSAAETPPAARSTTSPGTWVLAAVAVVVASGLVWVVSNRISRTRAAARLPALPEFAAVSPAIADRLRQLDAVARADALSADAVGTLGIAYHANLFTAQAAQAYALAVERAPDNPRWTLYLSLIAEERGMGDVAAGHLERALRLDGANPVAWYRLGEAEFKRGRDDAAEAAYRRALDGAEAPPQPAGHGARTAPVSAYAALGLARLAERRGDVTAARQWLEKSIASAEAFGPGHRMLAEMLDRAGDAAAAERHRLRADALGAYVPPADPLVDALSRESRHSTFLLKQAALAQRARDATWRELVTRRAYEFDRGNPDVLFEMAALLHATGRYEEALALYRQQQAMAPGDRQTQAQIGKCLGDLKRYDEAERVLLVAVGNGDASAEFNLGVVLEQQGRAAEARQHYERAIGLNPFHARALNNLGVALARAGDAAGALRLYERARQAAPADADVVNNIGVTLANLGRLDEAVAQFERALAIEPSQADARRNLDALRAAVGRAPKGGGTGRSGQG